MLSRIMLGVVLGMLIFPAVCMAQNWNFVQDSCVWVDPVRTVGFVIDANADATPVCKVKILPTPQPACPECVVTSAETYDGGWTVNLSPDGLGGVEWVTTEDCIPASGFEGFRFTLDQPGEYYNPTYLVEFFDAEDNRLATFGWTFCEPVSADDMSWGQIKATYR